VKEAASEFPKFHFELAIADILLERAGMDKQCSGKVCQILYSTSRYTNAYLLLVYLAVFQIYSREL
jgi:hypothetical protein